MKREKKDNAPRTGSGDGASGGGREKITTILSREEIEASLPKMRELKLVQGVYPIRMRHYFFEVLKNQLPDWEDWVRSLYDDCIDARSVSPDERGSSREVARLVRVIRDMEEFEFTRQCEVLDRAVNLLIDATSSPEAYENVSTDEVTIDPFNGDDDYVLRRLPEALRNRILFGLWLDECGEDDGLGFFTLEEQRLIYSLGDGLATRRYLYVLMDRLEELRHCSEVCPEEFYAE